MTIDSTGNVGIGTTTPGTKLAVAGLTGTASYNLVRVDTATGNFYYDSSSERYKDNIRVFDTDFSKILNIEPKIFIDKASGNEEIGFIAEEFEAAGLNELVTYGQDSRPDGLKYDKVPVYFLQIIKAQQVDLQVLKEQLGLATSSAAEFDIQPAAGFAERIKQALLSLGLAIKDGFVQIKELAAETVTAKKLCLEDVCVTRDELKALLEQRQAASVFTQGFTIIDSVTPTPETTPAPTATSMTETLTPTPETTPEPETTPTPETTPEPTDAPVTEILSMSESAPLAEPPSQPSEPLSQTLVMTTTAENSTPASGEGE
jgi:hypothetical protein